MRRGAFEAVVLERHPLTDASVAPGVTSQAGDALNYICVLILLYINYICVLILLCICPHTAKYASSYYCICVLILGYMCPHTTVHVVSPQAVDALHYICVLILLYIYVPVLLNMRPHTTVHVVSPQAVDALQRAVQLGKLNLIYLTKPHTFH
jgi:hypothetical protein